jgi:hypothetical protein
MDIATTVQAFKTQYFLGTLMYKGAQRDGTISLCRILQMFWEKLVFLS